MTNTPPILLLAHFCEIHGPQTILSTRLYPPSHPAGSSETGTSCANCSYNVPNTTTTPVLRTQSAEHVLISSRTTTDPLLREACVRALSVETLGKGQLSGSFVINTEIKLWGNEETRNLNVVHVFRLSDPKARGQKRVYAFVAIGETSLLRRQGHVLRVFEKWGRSIEELSERQLRGFRQQQQQQQNLSLRDGKISAGGRGGDESAANEGIASLSSSMDFTSATPSPPLSLETPLDSPSPPKFPSPGLARQRSNLTSASPGSMGSGTTPTNASTAAAAANAANTATAAQQKNVTPVSSFLSAKTVDPDGYPRSATGTAGWANLSKTRSLAEIVGDEFFFVRLHAEFCSLMESLVRKNDGFAGSNFDDRDEGQSCAYGSGRAGSASDDAEETYIESDEDFEPGSSRFGLDSEEMMGKWRIDE